MLLSNTFGSSTSASNGRWLSETLASAELITVTTHNGRPQTIRAGKPVYQAAFRAFTQGCGATGQKWISPCLANFAKVEAKTIEKAEAELALLGSLPTAVSDVGPDQLLIGQAANKSDQDSGV